jgi:hypothetical protein
MAAVEVGIIRGTGVPFGGVLEVDGAGEGRGVAGEIVEQGNPVGAEGRGHARELGEGGEPVVELGGMGADAISGKSAGPAHQGGHADAALPDITFHAVQGTVGAEKTGILGDAAAAAGLVMGAIVGGEHDQGVVIQAEVGEMLHQVAHGVVQSADHGGVALGVGGPALRGVVGVNEAVDGTGGGVDDGTGGAGPLHPAVRIGLGRHFQPGVGGGVGQIEEKGLFGGGGVMVGDPLFGPGGEEVGGIGLVKFGAHQTVVFVDALVEFLGIVVMGIHVMHDAEVEIETPVKRMTGEVVVFVTANAPFAHGGGGVAGIPENRGQGVVVFQGFVELVVAHVGVPLMQAGEQRTPGGGADGGTGVMTFHADPLRRKLVQVRGVKAWQALGTAEILVIHPHVAVSEVVGEHEHDVGAGRFREKFLILGHAETEEEGDEKVFTKKGHV